MRKVPGMTSPYAGTPFHGFMTLTPLRLLVQGGETAAECEGDRYGQTRTDRRVARPPLNARATVMARLTLMAESAVARPTLMAESAVARPALMAESPVATSAGTARHRACRCNMLPIIKIDGRKISEAPPGATGPPLHHAWMHTAATAVAVQAPRARPGQR